MLRKRALAAVSQSGEAQSPFNLMAVLPIRMVRFRASKRKRVVDAALKMTKKHLSPNPASRMIARELAILGLESLKESGVVFPPLQSTVGTILKLFQTFEVSYPGYGAYEGICTLTHI